MTANRPTADEVRKILSYDEETGVLRWIPKAALNRFDAAWNSRYAGKPAGGYNGLGYIRVSINDRLHLAHHIVWLLHRGVWPHKEVDHINRVTDDNRISNLRLAERFENVRNVDLKASNTSGFKGVCFDAARKKWLSRIRAGSRVVFLGRFERIEDAAAAYRAASIQHHGEFSTMADLNRAREQGMKERSGAP